MERIKKMDMVIRIVPEYGFLPILVDDNEKEIYRGEFYQSSKEALIRCIDRLNEMADERAAQ